MMQFRDEREQLVAEQAVLQYRAVQEAAEQAKWGHGMEAMETAQRWAELRTGPLRIPARPNLQWLFPHWAVACRLVPESRRVLGDG